jgi:hypothetical protein
MAIEILAAAALMEEKSPASSWHYILGRWFSSRPLIGW